MLIFIDNNHHRKSNTISIIFININTSKIQTYQNTYTFRLYEISNYQMKIEKSIPNIICDDIYINSYQQ